MTTTIYHNPKCGTSRKVLAMIRAAGEEPTVVEYLKTPPDRETLTTLIARMGISARDLLRRRGTPFEALGLDDPDLSDEALIDAMLAEPILINRPIVASDRGAALCRPPERVVALLETPAPAGAKAGGEMAPAPGAGHCNSEDER